MSDADPRLHVLVDDRDRDARAVLRITVEDLETGDTETKEMPAGEYFILTTSPCYVAHTSSYPSKGTHIVTVKGRIAR
jgi:hypothetical protein